MTIDRNEFFRQATLSLFSSLDIDKALGRFLGYIQQFIPADGLVLGMYDPEHNVGRMLAGIYPDHVKKPSPTITIPPELWDYLKQHWEAEAETSFINDMNLEDPEIIAATNLIWPNAASGIHMDLELEKHRLGVLMFFTGRKHQYSDVHVELISLLHDPMAAAVSNLLKHQEIVRLHQLLEDDNEFLSQQLMEMSGNTIIGADFGLSHVIEMVRQVAPMTSPVFLMGETGVGKEVIANAIHNASPRKGKPLIKVNCGAIPESLIDSELFGHEKGAFTGAVSMKRGLFERAHTGTIFLDEIGELPLAAQVRLLRVLQEKEIERVGGTGPISVDVRIVSATHRNLEQMVRENTFREDLWFRLNVFPIHIPPLRQRPEDIPALVSYFMERKSKELKIQRIPALDPVKVLQLQNYHWPGNVRELENVLERMLITGTFPDMDMFNDPPVKFSRDDSPPEQQVDTVSKLTLEQLDREYIERVLHSVEGKIEGVDGAAQWLGLHPSTLRARMKKLGIAFGRKKAVN